MKPKSSLLLQNQYFWLTNFFVWMAILAILTHIRWVQGMQLPVPPTWGSVWWHMAPWFVMWIPATGAVFYSNHKITQLNLPKWKQVGLHGLCMAMTLFPYWLSALTIVMLQRGHEWQNFDAHWIRYVGSSFQLDVLMYMGVLMLSKGLKVYHRMLEDRLELKNLQAALSHEQLKSLRSQLNPHFLFNALNTVASLVRLKREKEAVTALSELSHMLRKILESKNASDIKVRDEIAFIRSYLAIQKLRFAEKLDTHVEVDEDCLDLDIPNMLLHPLVENAVQHGSQLESNLNPLNIAIRRHDNLLEVTLTNKVALEDNHKGFGIGLGNTRERLQRLYKHFQLELKPLKDDVFQTTLAIPIGESDA